MEGGGKMSLWAGGPPAARKGRLHFRFRVNAQRIRHAINVIEIGNHLHCVENVAVIQFVFSQRFDVLPSHGGGRARYEFGKLTKCLLAWGKFGANVIVLYVLLKFGVLCFLTEILPVRFRSIETLVGPGHDRGKHLPFASRQAGRLVHGGQIQIRGRAQRFRIQTLDLQNVEHLPRAEHCPLVLHL
jgi:hypothetical protein